MAEKCFFTMVGIAIVGFLINFTHYCCVTKVRNDRAIDEWAAEFDEECLIPLDNIYNNPQFPH